MLLEKEILQVAPGLLAGCSRSVSRNFVARGRILRDYVARGRFLPKPPSDETSLVTPRFGGLLQVGFSETSLVVTQINFTCLPGKPDFVRFWKNEPLSGYSA